MKKLNKILALLLAVVIALSISYAESAAESGSFDEAAHSSQYKPTLKQPLSDINPSSSQTGIELLASYVPSSMIENEYLQFYVARDLVNSENNGRFTIGNTGGNPNSTSDNNKILLYGHPNPWSSFTTIRIDETNYIFYSNDTTYDTENLKAVSTMEVDGVLVTQTLQIIYNDTTGIMDTVQISYSAENKTNSEKAIGIRIMMDTMLGDNDGAPFKVPSLGNVTYECELTGNAIPQFWQAFDNLTNPSVFAVGTFYKSGDIKPDKVQFADWTGIYDISSLWSYTINTSRPVTGDSAVAVYWNPKSVAAGDTMTVSTYYGVGYSDGTIGSPDSSISISANEFVIEVRAKNGDAINRADVNIEGIGNATTNSNGIAKFTVNSTAQRKITVSAPGYQTTEVIRNVAKGSCGFIVLNPDDSKPYIKSIILDDKICLLSRSKSFQADTNNLTTSKVVITAEPKGVSDLRYRLVQNGLVIAENSTGEFNIPIQKDFKKDAPIYAYVSSALGRVESAKYLTGLKVIAGAVGSSDTGKFKIGEKTSFNLPGDWPIIGGDLFEFGFEEFPFQVDVDEDTIKIAIGITKDSWSDGSFTDDQNDRFWSDVKREYSNVLSQRVSGRLDAAKAFGGKPSGFGAGRVKLDVQLLGYGEGRRTSGNTLVNVGLYLKVKGEAGYTQYFFLGVVPVYASIKGGIEGDLKSTIGATFQNDSILPSSFTFPAIELKLSPYINPSAGAGVQGVLSVEVGGKLSFPLTWEFETEYFEAKADGKIYAKGTAFLFSAKIEKELFDVTIGSNYWGQTASSASFDSYIHEEGSFNPFSLFDSDNYSLMNRDYINKAPYSLMSFGAGNITTLRSNVYPQSQPQLISAAGKQYLFWLDDAAFHGISRSSENRTVLMYSVFDGYAWGNPEAVLEDGTADFYFDVATDGTNVYVAWTNCNQVFAPGVNLEEMIAATEITVAKINGVSVTETNTLTDNSYCDMLPAVSVNTLGDVFVAWVDKDDNNLFDGNICGISSSKYTADFSGFSTDTPIISDTTSPSSIDISINDETVSGYVYKQPANLQIGQIITDDTESDTTANIDVSGMDGMVNEPFTNAMAFSASWSAPSKVESFSSKQILSMDCGLIDGDFAVAYALDEDGDYGTYDDRRIYIRKEQDISSSNLSGNPSFVSNPQFGSLSGQEFLAWYNNGDISYITSGTAPAVINLFDEPQSNLTDNFSIISDGQETYIVWTFGGYDDIEKDYTNVFAVKHFGNSWAKSVKVSELNANASKLSGIINANVRPEVVFADRDETNDIYQIRRLEIVSSPDIELIDVEYDKESVEPETLLPLSLFISNKNLESVTAVNVVVSSSSGVVYTGSVPVMIPPGETAEVQITDFTLPNQVSVIEYTVTAYVQNEQNLSDNEVKILIGYTDLELTVDKYLTAGDWYVTVTIENKTGVPTNSTFRIIADELDGAVLYERRTGIIEKGTNAVMIFSLAQITESSNVETLYFSVVADEEELYTLNNTEMVIYTLNTVQNYKLDVVAGEGGTVNTFAGGEYHEGDVIYITATPNDNYRFINWTTSNGGVFADANSASTTFTMPDNDTTVTANFEFAPVLYTITATAGTGGTVSGGGTFISGSTVTLIATPESNYSFNGWYEGGVKVNGAGATYSFTATADRTLEARFAYKGGGSGGGGGYIPPTPAKLNITEATFDKSAPKDVPVTLTPGSYSLRNIKNGDYNLVRDQDYTVSGSNYTIKADYLATLAEGTATLTFDMSGGTDPTLVISIESGKTEPDEPAPVGDGILLNGKETLLKFNADGSVTILADDLKGLTAPILLTIPYENGGNSYVGVLKKDGQDTVIPFSVYRNSTMIILVSEPGTYAVMNNSKFFNDISGHWAAETIGFITARELFLGVGNNKFDPDGGMTRAMFAQVLANLDNADLTSYTTSRFTDVPTGQWYCAAVEWAADKGLVSGYGASLFGPDDLITREQIAVLLNNYLKYKGITLKKGEYIPFADDSDISSWAKEAVADMKSYGLIVGIGNNIYAPIDTVNRASVAQIFRNLIEAFIK